MKTKNYTPMKIVPPVHRGPSNVVPSAGCHCSKCTEAIKKSQKVSSTGYKIDKHVPLPVGTGQAGKMKYPWTDLEVGDSFVTEYTPVVPDSLKIKVTMRRLSDGKYRLWRIA